MRSSSAWIAFSDLESSAEVGAERSAQADVESAKADSVNAQWNSDQSEELFKAGAIPERDLRTSQQALVAANHHDHSGDSYATFRFLGAEGLIKGTIGLLYNYPHGRPDTLQLHSNRIAPETWFDIKLEGLWIPDAFIGPIASLMDAIQHDGTPITDVADNLGTLRVVHAAYRSAQEHRSVRPEELKVQS